ncbi:hypothetical protein V9T40_001439 [Parthenolecanium corni]|uniref:Uncharacterized protein n=1 Tax=Parthenolecanium corni TaxID=536013 RepID=A0AAN9Y544_9HEMI
MFEDFNTRVALDHKLSGSEDEEIEFLDVQAILNAQKKLAETLQQARQKAVEKRKKQLDKKNISFEETEEKRQEKIEKIDANRTEYFAKIVAEASDNNVNYDEDVNDVKDVNDVENINDVKDDEDVNNVADANNVHE